MLADSEESVESDEDFYFVDDNKNQSPKGKKLPNSKTGNHRVKAIVQGLEEVSQANGEELRPAGDSEDFSITKPDDFARIMSTFDGFHHDGAQKSKEKDRKSVRSYKNKLFDAAHAAENKPIALKSSNDFEMQKQNGEKPAEINTQSEAMNSRAKSDLNNEGYEQVDAESSKISSASTNCCTENLGDFVSGLNSGAGSCDSVENKTTSKVPTLTSDAEGSNSDASKTPMKDKQTVGDNETPEEKNDLSNTEQNPDYINQEMLSAITQPSSVEETESTDMKSSAVNSSKVGTSSKIIHEKTDSKAASSQDSSKSSTSSKTLEKSQDTYITVLPNSRERSTGENDSKSDSDVGTEEEFDGVPDNRFNKTGKSRGKCLSYLVVSSGEGHVDLRLKVKSKQDLKKDAQSMFLIWRVNSKI